MTGTLLKCDCCGAETLAQGHFAQQILAIKDRRHGTMHQIVLGLQEIVALLDPQGTTFQARR